MAVLPPCDVSWATVADVMAYNCDGGPCVDLAGTDPYVLQAALDDASFLLNAWTAFQYNGPCEATVRPVVKYGPAHGYPEWVPPLGAYSWGLWPWGQTGTGTFWGGPVAWAGWGTCGGGCESPLSRRTGCHGGPSQVALGAYPLTAITEVVIDGAVLSDAEYKIVDERWLVRVPPAGEKFAHWPCCNETQLPSESGDTDPTPTWQVTFEYGQAPPDIAVRAAIDYGCQLAQERCSGDCAVPANVSQLSREGVSIALVRPSEDVIDNLPQSVRAFINAVNPRGLRTRPRVWSPDLPRQVVTDTWVAP